jgi:hypothetical protein
MLSEFNKPHWFVALKTELSLLTFGHRFTQAGATALIVVDLERFDAVTAGAVRRNTGVARRRFHKVPLPHNKPAKED